MVRKGNVIPVTPEVAEFGELHRRDYGKAHGIGLADAIIAATFETEKEDFGLALLDVFARMAAACRIFGVRGGNNVPGFVVPMGFHADERNPANWRTMAAVRTPSGKLELFIPELAEGIRRLDAREEAKDLAMDPAFPLILSAGRHMDYNANTLMRNPEWNKGKRACTVALSPKDAEALGLADGEQVTVTTRAGSASGELQVSAQVRPGTVIIPHGFGLITVKRCTASMSTISPRAATEEPWAPPCTASSPAGWNENQRRIRMSEIKYLQDAWQESTCFGCGPSNPHGMHLKSRWSDDGRFIVAEYQANDKFNSGMPDVMYGGTVASLIDCHSIWTAIAFAHRAESREPGSHPPLLYVTGKLSVKYIKPTPISRRLHLKAWVDGEIGRKILVFCELGPSDGVTATGRVTAVRIG